MSSLSLRCLDCQFPFLFLSGTQFITEYVPLHHQCLVRQTFSRLNPFLINLSVPHHTDVHEDTVTVTFLIRILKTNNRIGQIQCLAFQQFITAKYIHHYIGILFRSSEIEYRRMSSVKFRILCIEPHGGLNRRTFVVRREKNRICFRRHFFSLVIFHRCLQHIRPGRKFPPIEGHFLIRSKRSGCNRFLAQLLVVLIFRRI